MKQRLQQSEWLARLKMIVFCLIYSVAGGREVSKILVTHSQLSEIQLFFPGDTGLTPGYEQKELLRKTGHSYLAPGEIGDPKNRCANRS